MRTTVETFVNGGENTSAKTSVNTSVNTLNCANYANYSSSVCAKGHEGKGSARPDARMPQQCKGKHRLGQNASPVECGLLHN